MKGRTNQFFVVLCLVIFGLSMFTPVSAETTENPGPFFSISILAPNSCPARNQWHTLMVEQLPKIGIEIDIFDHTGWSQIVPRTWGYPGPFPIPPYNEGGFDYLGVGWSWGIDVDMTGLFHSSMMPPVNDNFYQYSNPEMDWALENLSSVYLAEDQLQYINQIQDILYEDLPQVTIIYPMSLYPHDINFDQTSWDGLLWTASYQSMQNWSIPSQTEFHYATPADFEDFHPHLYESVYDAQWLHQIYSSLIERESDTLSWKPELASSYSTTNGLNWTVTLKSGLKWADGTNITTDDIIYSYESAIYQDLKPASWGLPYLARYLPENSVYKVDATTIKINLNSSATFPENLLDVPIIPKHIWESIPFEDHEGNATNWANTIPTKLLGAGPYYLFDYDYTNYIIHLKRNDYYHLVNGEVPYFEDIYFEFNSNKEGALAALASGAIDMVDAQFSPQLTEIPAGTAYTLIDDPGTQEMALNNLHPYLGTGELCPISSPESGKHIRKAMSHVVPRDIIVNEILDGLGKPGITAYPSTGFGFNDELEHYEYSFDLALEHMAAAGFEVPSPGVSVGLEVGVIMTMLSLIGASIIFWRRKRK